MTVFDENTFATETTFTAFNPRFNGGVNVAVDSDPVPEPLSGAVAGFGLLVILADARRLRG